MKWMFRKVYKKRNMTYVALCLPLLRKMGVMLYMYVILGINSNRLLRVLSAKKIVIGVLNTKFHSNFTKFHNGCHYAKVNYPITT